MTKSLTGLMAFGRDQFRRDLGQLADETLLGREADETKSRIDAMRAGHVVATIEEVDAEYERLAAIMAALDSETDQGAVN